MRLSVGQVVQDRFEVERILGAGGTAIVYLVKDRVSQQHHALKLLTVSSSAIRERMLREGRVQSRIAHPNVIRVTEVLDHEGAPALVMEFVDGPSLEQALGRYRLTMGDAETLFQGVLAGVAASHAEGLIHRDLKPANILLSRTRDGFVPKVTDFGLAKLTDDDNTKQVGQTRSGIAMGTPSYMSPEQIRDARSVDRRADLWSLGCILYELVTRQRTFPGDEALAIYNAIVEGDFVPVRTLAPDVPARIEQAIHGCLRVDPDDRIPDCDELLAVLLGIKAWPLPENTLTELARETPATPVAPATLPPRESAPPLVARVEFHPGGAPPNGTGITAASAPTALSPMTGTLHTSSRPSGGRFGLASESETSPPYPVESGRASIGSSINDEDEAATVIVRVPLDGTLAPHVSPHAEPPERRGLWLGGGLVAAAGLLALGTAAIGLLLAILWLVAPEAWIRGTPRPDQPVPVRSEPQPAPTAPQPPPTTPQPPPTTPEPGPPPNPVPAPQPTTPAPTQPAPPRPAPALPVSPKPPPKPAEPAPPSGEPQKVEVVIGTVPPGATINVGNLRGAGPAKFLLVPNRHPVIVSAPGYQEMSDIANIKPDIDNVWCFDLVLHTASPKPCP